MFFFFLLLNLEKEKILKIQSFSFEEIHIPAFFRISSEMDSDVLLNLEIPSINLKQSVYSIDSWKNQISFHVEMLIESNISQNVYFLAAHSGNSSVSFFNKLSLLKVGDEIYLKKGQEEFLYVVSESYLILKNGIMEVEPGLQDVIFLITCSLEYSNKQLIVKGVLV